MNMRTLLSLLVIVMSLGTLESAVAEDMSAMPEVKTTNGIEYLSGGIGKDQSDAMKAAAKDYTLMLTCAQAAGEYLADVKVNITDKSGASVLETVMDGPFLLARLPTGRYRISAQSNDVTVNKTVNISAKHSTRVNLYWKAGAAESKPADSGL